MRFQRRTLMQGAWGLVASAVLACSVAGGARAAPPHGLDLPSAAREYADRVGALPRSPARVDLESLFTLASSAAEALTYSPGSNRPFPVEDMDDSTVALARQLLPGITIIHWEEGYGAVPDDSFFLDLAVRRGTPADVEFFRLRTATSDGWYRRVWEEMVTDYSNCTKFGSGAIVSAWSGWNEYARRYPRHYVAAVAETGEEIRQELLEGDCVCGGKDDLLRELRRFVERLPGSELTAAVKHRIEAVEGATVRIRYNCRPR